MNRILFIDDRCDDFRVDFEEIFDKREFEITYCSTKDEGIEEVKSGKEYDILLLDWYLEQDDSSILSQQVLSDLKKSYYLPVLIWSNHLADFENTEVSYPAKLIEGISKVQFTPNNLKLKINNWLDSSNAAKISHIYRTAIRKSLEEVFFDITELPENDIVAVLRHVAGTDKNIDWSNDFILNLIHRKLTINQEFQQKVIDLMNTATSTESNQTSTEKNKILNKILYFHSDFPSARCGDIVEININAEHKLYGVICNPDCDLFTLKTRYVELVELRNYPDDNLAINSSEKGEIKRNNHDSYYVFPAIKMDEENYKNYIAVFKSKIVIELKSDIQQRFPLASKRIEYTDSFIFNGGDVKLKLLCSFVNPYKSDFLQRLHTHNSRVGTPNVKNLYQL